VWRSKVESLGLVLLLASPASANPWFHASPGSLVSVEVLVEGVRTPLYAAPDGSGRWYLEARESSRYAIRLQNRTAQRLGVSLQVDGLNVISGSRPAGQWRAPDPGPMYVLEPWDATEIGGWRTSLRDVQRFVFVDERASYAARTGQGNARMGWIEVSVYRERYPHWPQALRAPRDEPPSAAGRPSAEPAPEADAARKRSDAAGERSAAPRAAPTPPSTLGSADSSYPGTGWGPRAHEPVQVVSFDPEPHPTERVTLRYEYRRALAALGIDLGPRYPHDRLRQRERGGEGFARPPDW
jgi:hypothetical protein